MSQAEEIENVVCSCLAEGCEKLKTYGIGYSAEWINNSMLATVITADKAVCGICVCEKSPVPDSCEIIALYIKDGYQSKGLGRKLLSYSLREMRARRMKTAFAWLDERSPRVAAFFSRIGFVHDSKRRKMLGINEDYNELRYRIDI